MQLSPDNFPHGHVSIETSAEKGMQFMQFFFNKVFREGLRILF